MKKKKAVWQLIKDNLDAANPVMLLYVVESKGSSPGRQGFVMAVTSEGRMEGSIGGGIMEHKLVEKAKRELQVSDDRLPFSEVVKQVHDKTVSRNQSGMICSGEQTILLYTVQEKDKQSINQIISCIDRLESGSLQLSPQGINFQPFIPVNHFLFQYTNENDWKYEELLGYTNHLYIIGGGHCAWALSNLASTLGFYIHLFDDRENLVTMEVNQAAHEKVLLHSYSELNGLIPEGEKSYVVVMTFGYRTDDIVVRTLLRKTFKYFGLLGSKAKIEKMLDDYQMQGLDEKWLKSIYAPIGIPIKSQTPEEIAVSIAAELIQVKNSG